jgi:DivIVA domain-containing protein
MAKRDFMVVLRGYDRNEVDRHLDAAEAGTPADPPSFRIVLRGYNRFEVDKYIEDLANPSS